MTERPGEEPTREAPPSEAPGGATHPAADQPPPPRFAPPAGASQPDPPAAAYPPAAWSPPGSSPYPPHGHPPGGWHSPPPGWYPAYGYPPPPPRPKESGPSNDVAVAGFCLSVTAGVLLLFSTGIASPLTLILAIVGMVLSRRGRGRVDRGETDRHRDLGQAGFIVGIVALVLSVLGLLFWAGILVVAILAEQSSTNPGPGGLDSVRAALAGLARP